jgi:hypothetical protein
MSQTPIPFSSSFRSLTLNVTTGTGQNQVTHTQAITSVFQGNNSFPITDADILNAFNSQAVGTSFTSSIVAEFGSDGNGNALKTVSTPSVASFIPRVISLADIPNKLTTDASFSLSSLITTVSAGVLSYSSSNTDVATIILIPSTLYSINNPTLYSKLTNFTSISILSDWEINISFVTTTSGRYQALISDRTGYSSSNPNGGWTIWLNNQGGVHITSYTQGLYLDFLNGSILPNKNYILTVRRTTNVLYVYVNDVDTGNTVSTSYNGNVTFTPDENVYAGFIPGSANTPTEGFQGTISAINVLSLNLLPSINIVGAGTTTITVSQAATANHPAASASAMLTVTLPPLIIRASNNVTIQYTGAAGDVTDESPLFIQANPHGTGDEWFAVVKQGMKQAIKNYANGISNTPFVRIPGDNSTLIPFNNIVTSLMTDMSYMFHLMSTFNQPLNSWDVSKVTTMSNMFGSAFVFNHPLYAWNVSSVTNMNNMFDYAVAFNQNLSGWNVALTPIRPSLTRNAFAIHSPLALPANSHKLPPFV